MYQSDSFFIGNQKNDKMFYPNVTSVYKVLCDNAYSHSCNDDELFQHEANTIALIRCVEGKGLIYVKNSVIHLNKDEFIFIKFHDIKKYKCSSAIWEYRWINFTAKYINEAFKLNKIYCKSKDDYEENAFNELLLIGKSDVHEFNFINTLFLKYFYSVMIEEKFDLPETEADGSYKLIDDICSYINQKLYSKITIAEIARFFKISTRRLHQIFIKELEISPKQYIIKKKMEEAYKLLVQTSTPINRIAYMLCFSSPYHFTNEFKKLFGQSPSAVRNLDKQ